MVKQLLLKNVYKFACRNIFTYWYGIVAVDIDMGGGISSSPELEWFV